MSGSQCISLLKSLSSEGRTVICSIHTPSAKLFAMFDNILILAGGVCVYRGSSGKLLPFLECVGLKCPKHYNPADYSEYIIGFPNT